MGAARNMGSIKARQGDGETASLTSSDEELQVCLFWCCVTHGRDLPPAVD